MTDENNTPKIDEGEKKAKNNNAKISVTILLVVVAVIVVATFLIANSDAYFSSEPTTKMNVVDIDDAADDKNDDGVSSASSKGFPVSFGNSVIESAVSANTCVFTLTHEAVACISNTGKITFTYALSFSDPAIKSSSDYAIVYDRQGSGFIVFNKKGLYFEGTSDEDGKILIADVSNDGKAIIASRRAGSASALSVYKKGEGCIFAWACAKEHILAVDISKNDKNLVCAAIGSAGGEVYTKCYVFNIDAKENIAELEFQSSAPTDCIIESSKVHLVCTDKISVFDYTEEEPKPITYEFDSTVIKRACDSSGNVAVLTKKIDSFGENELTFYNSYNKPLYSLTLSEKICDLKVNGNTVYVLTASELMLVNAKGQITKEIDVESASDGLVVDSRRYYRYYLGVLYKI